MLLLLLASVDCQLKRALGTISFDPFSASLSQLELGNFHR